MSETKYVYPKQVQLEGSGYEVNQKSFVGSETTWTKFLKPTVNVAVPFIGIAVVAKSKDTAAGQATAGIVKKLSGGKLLS